ncbi:hypothetical protein EI42_02924 [Thermosporothrix hazakensis]|jgi:hypothetical protein|uniref:HAMP domain-containing protein n=2 Tax=Thermosporothrix TaxID=768650 RepID=A0A326U6G9_THEHA|nr:hypothetical protein [Thermosporothrix hazakensis]PZW29202.1 hypothetical protein EI42_02924 [Thermosporothrix hazakensis]BBH86129.1 hypothetical protein KTC_08800 [Thermosporothrix sp. COM3]GCE45446.1 hypothetical protein KTH_03150 [Thermosporothrix hazakensis]
MNKNQIPQDAPGVDLTKALREMVAQREDDTPPLFRKWYKLTAIPEAPRNASLTQREESRQSRLISTVFLFLIIVLICFIPATFLMPNHFIPILAFSLLGVAIISLIVNRRGKVLLAGIIGTFGYEAVVAGVIFTSTPLDTSGIMFYLYGTLAVLLAASFLPAKNAFLIAFINAVMIAISMVYQPHTADLNQAMHSQFIPMLIQPIGTQFIVAGVAYVWSHNVTRALARADRTEMITSLQRTIAEKAVELEQGVQLILKTHIEIANGNLNARAPLSQGHELWQVARALNTLLVRYQRAALAEKEFHRVEQAIQALLHFLQDSNNRQQKQILLPMTQTLLDNLLIALQGKTLAYSPQPYPHQRPTITVNAEPNSQNSQM